jgi:hypothetical protein
MPLIGGNRNSQQRRLFLPKQLDGIEKTGESETRKYSSCTNNCSMIRNFILHSLLLAPVYNKNKTWKFCSLVMNYGELKILQGVS